MWYNNRMNDKEKKNKEKKDREISKFLSIACTRGYAIPAIYNTWYKAKDASELNFIIKWFSADVDTVRGKKDLEVNQWFTVTLEYLPNNTWSREFITLKKYEQLVKEMFDDFNTIERKNT